MKWPRTLTVPRAPDFIIGGADDPYLLRWYVIPRNRWFNIYLHRFMRSDDPRALHDHPWANMSILLRGRYVEHLADGTVKIRRAPGIVCRSATAAHRIHLIAGRPVWTLFLTGRKVRTWGFLCPKGWRSWQEFCNPADDGATVGRGCDD